MFRFIFVAVGWQWAPCYRGLRWSISRTSDDRWVWRIRRIVSSSDKSKLSERRLGTTIAVQAWTCLEGSKRLRLPHFKTIGTWRWLGCQPKTPAAFTPLPPPRPGNISGTHFCYRLSRPQGHNAVGRFGSMRNSNDTVGNRTRAMAHPTASPRAPVLGRKPVVISLCPLQRPHGLTWIINKIFNLKSP